MSATPAAASGTRISWLNNPIVLVGLALVVVQTIVRGTAAFHGWFYADDFELLTEATGRRLSLGYLMAPHDSQLMPAGMLAIWWVAHTAPYHWALAATITVVLQLLAGLACWLMLCRVFGVRWWCLAVLAFYLFSTMTLTAFMWWAAALNQVPTQLAFFLVVTAHVEFLRTRRLRFALLAAGALAFGLLFYVKALLILVPVVLLTFLYFDDTSASPGSRLRTTLRRHWQAWILYALVAGVYLQYYVRHVPNPIASDRVPPYAELFDTMLRQALGPVLLGGPWRWSNQNPPVALVATPEWAVTLSWVAIAVALALAWRARRIDLKAFIVVVPYLLISAVLVARGRASFFGEVAGLELRYLADSAPVLALGIGLLIAGRQGLVAARDPRPTTAALPTPSRSHLVSVGIAAAMLVGVAVSTVTYVRFWAAPYPSRAFTQTVIRESSREALEIVDVPVPEEVLSGAAAPNNLPSRFFRPLGEQVRATTMGTDLEMLTASGVPGVPFVSGATSVDGSLVDCGYAVNTASTPIRMSGAPPGNVWWLEMSYLAGDDGTVQLHIGDTSHLAPVRKGLHRLYLRGEGSVDGPILVRSLTPDVGLCVDRLAVGDVGAVTP